MIKIFFQLINRSALNIDLLDFFHYVTSEKVRQIFTGEPFKFEEQLCNLLVDLCTFNNWLPMGAPSSPVLSNFALVDVDKEIEEYCRSQDIQYSRFVDDMSFSSSIEINTDKIEHIKQIIEKNNYKLNPNKIKYYGPADIKKVTGVTVFKDQIGVEDRYVDSIEEEMQHLKKLNLANTFYEYGNDKYMDKLRAAIKGRIEFVHGVLGKDHEIVKKLRKSYSNANKVTMDDYGTMSWLDFDY